jgi:outer membrane protein TolC
MYSRPSLGGSPPPVRGKHRDWLHKLGTLITVVVSVGMASFVSAQPSSHPLTLDAALTAAQSRSASLQAQDAATRAAREMAVSAGRLPDPELRLSVDNLPIEGPMRYQIADDFMTMRSVSLMQTFTGIEKRQARAARYEREADVATALKSWQKTRLLAQTAGAWLDRYFQEQVNELLLRQHEDAQKISTAIEAAYRSGRSSQADVLAARTSLAQINERLHLADAELATARAQLNRWVGDIGERPLGLLPKISYTRQAEHYDIERHPDIAVITARERVAQAEADVAAQETNADWSWSLMYSKRGSQFGDMVSLGVSIPLQWDQSNKQDREYSAKMQVIDQLKFEREEIRRELLFGLQQLLANWRANISRLADYDRTLIPLATERVQALEADFRSGKTPLSAVLEAHRMVTDTRLERLRIEKQTAATWVELEFLFPLEQLTSAHPLNQLNPEQ